MDSVKTWFVVFSGWIVSNVDAGSILIYLTIFLSICRLICEAPKAFKIIKGWMGKE